MFRYAVPTLVAVLITAALWVAMPVGAGWWGGGSSEEETEEARRLDWEELVDPEFEPPADPFATMSREDVDKLYDGSDESNRKLAEYEEMFSVAPVNETLDGKLVTLPGYVVPLDFDGNTRLDEFLLVPYFGACIHTPPPPSNQVVLASPRKPVEIEDIYSPVLLRGVLRTDLASTPLAESGYRMEVRSVEPYTP